MKARIFQIFLSMFILLAAFTNCGKSVTLQGSTSSTQNLPDCSTGILESLRSPKTIDEALNLANALPKPVSVDCFVSALKRPLSVYAVDNVASAQPSAGPQSPRIFILMGNFSLSVVPEGESSRFIEMSQLLSQTTSVKGEIPFPVEQILAKDAPYSRILDGVSGTSCRNCHRNESGFSGITSGQAFISEVIRPNPFHRVPKMNMLEQAQACGAAINFRCRLLRTIYIDGKASDVEFPMGPSF